MALPPAPALICIDQASSVPEVRTVCGSKEEDVEGTRLPAISSAGGMNDAAHARVRARSMLDIYDPQFK